jgi:hypothetical protein
VTPNQLRADARALIADIAVAQHAIAATGQFDAPGLQLRVALLCAEASGLPRGAARDLLGALADLKLALDDLSLTWQGKTACASRPRKARLAEGRPVRLLPAPDAERPAIDARSAVKS